MLTNESPDAYLPTRTYAAQRVATTGFVVGVTVLMVLVSTGCAKSDASVGSQTTPSASAAADTGMTALALGKHIFRHDTFGDDQFWTDTLHLNSVIEQSVDPTTALKIGLKVDADVLPEGILKTVDLKNPATTVALLKINAIVGVQAVIDSANHITKLGITCALCHSTVDNAIMPGIGHRQDGWPNRDLNVGAIIALSPALSASKKAVYNSWGPGMYDPRYNIDGKSTPLVLPPAYGLANVTNETYTAEGPISYWNAYVAVTQMHGRGNFADASLGIDIKQTPDLVTPKLSALRAYQHSLTAPPPPPGSVDMVMAERGHVLFDTHCVACHVGTTGTDNNTGVLHAPRETGMDGAYASRTKNKMYRTTPLRGLWQHAPYFHDGRAKTLADVVAHYNDVKQMQMTPAQRRDLVEYLKAQ